MFPLKIAVYPVEDLGLGKPAMLAIISLRVSLKTSASLHSSIGDIPEKHPQSSGRMGGAPPQLSGDSACRGELYASTGLKAGQHSPLPTGQEWFYIPRRVDRAVCVLGCKELLLDFSRFLPTWALELGCREQL